LKLVPYDGRQAFTLHGLTPDVARRQNRQSHDHLARLKALDKSPQSSQVFGSRASGDDRYGRRQEL
jgi:hypothetical protein